MPKALIDYALEWAANGVPVFPCNARKEPLTERGFYDAVTDPKQVRALFEFYGDDARLIGGRMGAEAGLIAVDVDLYKAGAEQWLKAREDDGSLGATRIHKTPRGGLHFLYEADEFPTTVVNDGVDIKGDGGYVILPGSPGYSVEQEGLARAPSLLMELIKSAKRGTQLTGNLELEAQVISARDFHESLTLLAARRASNGVALPDIMSYLMGLMRNSVAAHPGHDRHSRWNKLMSGDEVSRIATSALRKYGRAQLVQEMQQNIPDEVWEQLEVEAERVFPFLEHVDGPAPEYEPVEGSWPYQGYEAHENYDIADQEFYIYPICAQSETVVMFAEPKTGKTALSLTMALNLSCGFDWGEFKVTDSGPSLYFAMEGTRAVRLRIAAWRKRHTELGVELPDRIPMYVVEGAPGFYKENNKKEHAKRIIAHNKMCEAEYGAPLKLIVIDTLTKAMAGGDQNSAEDTAELFEIIGLLRSGGIQATIIFVHHKARGAGNARGSSNIEAEPDVLLDVSKEGDIVSMKVARARSIEDGQVYNFKLEGVELGVNKQGHPLEGVIPNWVNVSEHRSEFIDRVLLLGKGSHGLKSIMGIMAECGLMDEVPARATAAVTDKLREALGGDFYNGTSAAISIRYNEKGAATSVDINALG